ncbi:uncharacterized protein LOC133778158 [Humulus lupulus]|uniref:uncharacterized protein LOC133778158 n=1 Tax=Humulus lupulus TaxID=3486 RepID=UPI002B40C914|nr:uncharacterized protein LOC133778158 [Humulus lupulus]
MPMAETVKPSGSSSEGGQNQKNKLDREVRDMVSAITNRLTNIHKVSSGLGHDQNDDDDEEDKGVRIITLAGNNTGATLRGELDDNTAGLKGGEPPVLSDSETMKTFVNSNFQAVNNSIMMGGSYNTNDPGVHVEISDFGESQESKPEYRRGWKGKKKTKEALKSDHKSSSSD